MIDLRHKRKPAGNGRGPHSVCGQYGFTTHLWARANCRACLAKRVVKKR